MTLYSLGGRRPSLPDDGDVFVAPSADVIGDVHLARGVSIWFGVVLRGDNDPIYVGENSNIQDLSVVHTDPGLPARIGRDVTIGHRVILHSCEIGDGALIGMGATILNNARIGRNCLVGANSLVTEGKEFPNDSLIMGAPAKIVKTLDAATMALFKLPAQIYIANGERYRKELEVIDA